MLPSRCRNPQRREAGSASFGIYSYIRMWQGGSVKGRRRHIDSHRSCNGCWTELEDDLACHRCKHPSDTALSSGEEGLNAVVKAITRLVVWKYTGVCTVSRLSWRYLSRAALAWECAPNLKQEE